MNWYPFWRSFSNYARKHIWPGQVSCDCTNKHHAARKQRAIARHGQ